MAGVQLTSTLPSASVKVSEVPPFWVPVSASQLTWLLEESKVTAIPVLPAATTVPPVMTALVPVSSAPLPLPVGPLTSVMPPDTVSVPLESSPSPLALTISVPPDMLSAALLPLFSDAAARAAQEKALAAVVAQLPDQVSARAAEALLQGMKP